MKIKVVSLNVWDGGRLFDELVDFCRGQAADIYLFQEVFNDQDPALERRYRAYAELQKELHLPHTQFAPTYVGLIDGVKHLQGNAVMSRFSLSPVSVRFYDEPFQKVVMKLRPLFPFIPRSLQHVVADIDGVSIHVLNTQGIWGEDGDDTPRRINMGRIIAQEVVSVGRQTPLVLAGDFNVDPNTESIRQIDVHLKSVFKGELSCSFNLQQKDLGKYPGYAKAVVDMMFVSDVVKVIEHSCPRVNVSDHLPLVAVLEI